MSSANRDRHLRIVVDTKECTLSAAELAKIDSDAQTLAKVIEDFPVADLYVTINRHPRSHDYHVKTSLVLTGKTLFTGERDRTAHPALRRCLGQLVKKAEAYKQKMQGAAEVAKHVTGTHQNIVPTGTVDLERAGQASDMGDYAAFRQTLQVFEEPLEKRIGRWIQRYPEIEVQLGERIRISDIVEDVFLNAFEHFAQRPERVSMGQWLEQWIDRSVRGLLESPDEELSNILFARTMYEAEMEARRKSPE